MRQTFRTLLAACLLQMVPLLVGCQGREPRFDIVPEPVSLALLWRTTDGTIAEAAVNWPCFDELHREYLRQYQALVARDAPPIIELMQRGDPQSWRTDPARIDRMVAHQSTLLNAMAALDEGLLHAIEECGFDPMLARRLRVARRIERDDRVIAGSGARVMNLVDLIPPKVQRRDEVAEVLLSYSEALADAMLPLREAERTRLARHARIVAALTAANDQIDEGSRLSRNAMDRRATSESGVPVDRALSRILDLNLITLLQLGAALSADERQDLEWRFQTMIDGALGGLGVPPGKMWVLEVALASPRVPIEARRSLRNDLERFNARVAPLRAERLAALRTGAIVPTSGTLPPALAREMDRLIGVSQGALPPDAVESLNALLHPTSIEAMETALRTLAPADADRLWRLVPTSHLPDELEVEFRSHAFSKLSQVVVGAPFDDRWLEEVLARARVPEEIREVARHLWRDHAIPELEASKPIRERVASDERALIEGFSADHDVPRLFDRFIASVEELRRSLELVEERYIDSLEPLLPGDDARDGLTLRLQRRIARDHFDWSVVPFSEMLGFGPECSVSMVELIAVAPLEPGEAAIAQDVLERRLPELAGDAAAFRLESVSALRRFIVEAARAGAFHGEPEKLTPVTMAISAQWRGPVNRHLALQRSVLDEVAELLPERARMLRRMWRRAAYPELFVDEGRFDRLLDMAHGQSRAGPEATTAPPAHERQPSASVEERIGAWEEVSDHLEAAMVDLRREAKC